MPLSYKRRTYNRENEVSITALNWSFMVVKNIMKENAVKTGEDWLWTSNATLVACFTIKSCFCQFMMTSTKQLTSLNPLNPKVKIWILICCPYSISYRSSGEKLIKYQAINSSFVIMSVILMTTLFYNALILQGEIWCWSLFGLNDSSSLVSTGPI